MSKIGAELAQTVYRTNPASFHMHIGIALAQSCLVSKTGAALAQKYIGPVLYLLSHIGIEVLPLVSYIGRALAQTAYKTNPAPVIYV